MSGANASPIGRSHQEMSGANASPIGRSHQEMSGANASPIGRSHQEMSGANASPIGRSHQEMTGDGIVFTNVSKFYGEVLGVNRINLKISPGITSLVGPN